METVRSITVHVEVDTNKQTYTADIDGTEVDDIGAAVNEWIRALAYPEEWK